MLEFILVIALGSIITPFALSSMIYLLVKGAEHDNKDLHEKMERRMAAYFKKEQEIV